MSAYKIGDIVKVVNASMTFGDYQNGDTARVRDLRRTDTGRPYMRVDWIKRTPEPSASGAPVTLLFPGEVELLQPEAVALNGLGPAQYPSPKQSLIARAMAKLKRSK